MFRKSLFAVAAFALMAFGVAGRAQAGPPCYYGGGHGHGGHYGGYHGGGHHSGYYGGGHHGYGYGHPRTVVRSYYGPAYSPYYGGYSGYGGYGPPRGGYYGGSGVSFSIGF